MKITWLGHACFLIETKEGIKLITDPYESGGYSGAVAYSPVGVQADIVTVSHQHADHNYIAGLGSPQVVGEVGKFSVKGIEIEGILSYHDAQRGSARGQNIIFMISCEGIKIVHFGDLGSKDIEVDRFQNIDIALIPTGGVFTINAADATAIMNAAHPRIAIPMHFKTDKLGFDIDGVDNFLQGKDYERLEGLDVDLQNLDSFKNIVVLEHQR